MKDIWLLFMKKATIGNPPKAVIELPTAPSFLLAFYAVSKFDLFPSSYYNINAFSSVFEIPY